MDALSSAVASVPNFPCHVPSPTAGIDVPVSDVSVFYVMNVTMARDRPLLSGNVFVQTSWASR
jgi:hypothetical protein